MADIARGVRSFTVGTAVSRVLGLVRESVVGHLFGAGMATDAFQAAFRIPNLLRDLFAENALSSAFVPVLASEKQKGKEAENRFASNVLNTLLLVVGLVSLAGMAASPYLAKAIAYGFGDVPGKVALTGKLTTVMFPFLLFVALAAWAMSVLNANGAFFVPALAPALFNIFSFGTPVVLFAYLRSRGVDPIFSLALGVTLGGLMQFLIQIPSLFRRGFRYRPYLNFRDPGFRKSMALFVPVAIGLSGSRINFFVNTMLISSLVQGSLSWLNYAYRIMHLPLGLFGIAIGTVALPAFSKYVAEGDNDAVRNTLFDSLRMVLFLTVPTSVIIAALSVPVTAVIYQHGRFTPADTAATAAILVLYMIGVPFMSAMRNVAGVFFATKDAKTPMIASFISVAVNLALNISLKGVLAIRAFPLSAAVAAFVNLAILYVLLPKKIGAFESRPLFRYASHLLLASLAGGAAAWGLYRLGSSFFGLSWIGTLAGMLISAAVGAGIFYLAALAIGLKDIRGDIRRFLRF